MKAWMRILEVHLTSRLLKRKFVFGANDEVTDNNLNISITGNKYMSTLKDTCTIRIDNLTYDEIVAIIKGKYYDVEVKCGYKDAGSRTIFKGGVLYISNALNSDKTNTVIILCGSQLVARYGQSRMNLTLNSGINMHSAIKFVLRRAGIKDAEISTQLKKRFLQETLNVNDTAGSWLNKLAQNNNSYITNSDSSTGSILSIYDANKLNRRVIKLTSDFINLSGGYPQLTEQGLELSVMPTFSFMCGDIIQIDPSLINLPVQNKSEVQKNYGYYLDEDGQYMIFEQNFNLQNRSSNFSITLNCKARNLISKFAGKTSTSGSVGNGGGVR